MVFLRADGSRSTCMVERATDRFVHLQVETSTARRPSQRRRLAVVKWNALRRWVTRASGNADLFAYHIVLKLALDELATWRDAAAERAIQQRRLAIAANHSSTTG